MAYNASNESINERQERSRQIVSLLKKTYPDAKLTLHYHSTWELLVAAILLALTTAENVNEVTQKLFRKYPTLEDFSKAQLRELEVDIKETGWVRNKAKAIVGCALIIKDTYNGHVPDRMTHLTNLPGVSRKIANIILGNAYNIVGGIAVDPHVHRLSQRLRLVDMERIKGGKPVYAHLLMREGKTIIDYKDDADPDKVEKELLKVIPKEEWFKFTYMVIDHGRAICKAQNPDCPNCPLKTLCPSSRV